MHTLDASILSITPGLGLAGPAFTALAEAGSIITVHKALLEATAGTVLVVGGETARGLDGALVTSSALATHLPDKLIDHANGARLETCSMSKQ
jgi:regulator of RNase E activity RraA